MAERIWIKFLCFILVMTSLVASGVTLHFPNAPIVQRVNLGVIMTRVTDDLNLQAQTWTHQVRMPLPREHGRPPPMARCGEDVDDMLCFMDTWLAIQSRLLAADVDKNIHAAAEFAKSVLPRLPPTAQFDSTTRLSGVGDAFHETLAGVRVYKEDNLTELTVNAAQSRVLSVPTEAFVASLSKLAVKRYKDAITALSMGRLENELLSKASLDAIMQDLRDGIHEKGLGLLLEETPVRDIYSSVKVQAYVDDDHLYISLPLTVLPDPSHSLDLYKVTVFPVAAGRASVHATKIVGFPDYLAVDRLWSKYATLSSDDLAGCLQKDHARCYKPSEMRPMEEPSCALGVFLDLAEMIRDHCEFDLIYNGAQRSVTEVMPGLLLLNNMPQYLLDCPKRHHIEDTLVFSESTQCLRYAPCVCAIATPDIRFSPYPCMNGTGYLCRLEFESPGDDGTPRPDLSSHPDCQPRPRHTSWGTHTVNMALWMAFGDKTIQHLRGGDLFPEEQDVHLPGVARIFQGWDGSLKGRIQRERARILRQRWHPNLTNLGVRVLSVLIFMVVVLGIVGVVVLARRVWQLHRLFREKERQFRRDRVLFTPMQITP